MNTNTIHVSLVGGLGNQLFQIAAALTLTDGPIVVHNFLGNARKDSCNLLDVQELNLPPRVVFKEKEKISKFGIRFLSAMYRTSVSPEKLTNRMLNFKPTMLFRDAYFSNLIGEPLTVIHAQDNGFFEVKPLNKAALLVGYFQSSFWPNQLREGHDFSQFFLKKIDTKSVSRDKITNKVLALHIRLGDYSNEPKIGMLDSTYYITGLELIANNRAIDEIWLFSDETEKAVKYIPQKWNSILKIVPPMSAAKTLELMRDADCYVISNSTFSWWGAFLSKSKTPLVFAPNPWFKGMKSPRRIIPLDWVILDAKFKQ